jgi:hypothetical protein
MNGTQKNMKQIVAAVERKTADGEVRTWWTRVGVAFENNDGSFNLLFDFVPTDPKTTLQLRDFDQERGERPERDRRSPRRFRRERGEPARRRPLKGRGLEPERLPSRSGGLSSVNSPLRTGRFERQRE